MNKSRIKGVLLLCAGILAFILVVGGILYFTEGKAVEDANGDVTTDGDASSLCIENSGVWSTMYEECTGITKEICEINGGTFNGCASPCRHDPEAVNCILMCEEVCEF